MQKPPALLGRRGPTWFHPSLTADCSTDKRMFVPGRLNGSPIRLFVHHPLAHSLAVTGRPVIPYFRVFRDYDLGDPLPGGFPVRPVERAFSRWPSLSKTVSSRYSSRSALSVPIWALIVGRHYTTPIWIWQGLRRRQFQHRPGVYSDLLEATGSAYGGSMSPARIRRGSSRSVPSLPGFSFRFDGSGSIGCIASTPHLAPRSCPAPGWPACRGPR
jgi:hypothetical protein